MTDTRDLHDASLSPDEQLFGEPPSAARDLLETLETRETLIDPRLLRYFVGVAEELHFGRASRRLHLAQQPLSQAIRRLEAQLGVTLFARTSRRVSLTDAGRVFLDETRLLLRRSADAVEAARRAARGETGTLAVGYTSGTLNAVMPRAVRRFRDRHPGVVLRLVELDTARVEARLGVGDLDVGLVCTPVADTALATEVVHREPIVLAVPEGHPLAARPDVRLTSAAAEPFVLHDRALRPTVRDLTVALCRAAGFSPHVVQEAATQAALVGLVAAGLGVALVCRSAGATAPSGVAFRPLADGTLTVDILAVWRRADTSPFVRDWIAAAHAAAADTVGARPLDVA